MPKRVVVKKNRIKAVAKAMIATAEATALEAAQATAERARELVPILTGTLQETIEAHPTPGGAEVTAGVGLDYGASVEYGTYRTEAQPFMTPAAEAVGRQKMVVEAVPKVREAARRAAR